MTDKETDDECSGLLPCPFCGGEAKNYKANSGCTIQCQKCRIGHIDTSQERAIKAWNTRATGSALNYGGTSDNHVARVDESTNAAKPSEALEAYERVLGRFDTHHVIGIEDDIETVRAALQTKAVDVGKKQAKTFMGLDVIVRDDVPEDAILVRSKTDYLKMRRFFEQEQNK